MKHFLLSLFFLAIATTTLSAQKYFTRTGHIIFSSDTPIEKIEAKNDKATCVVDTEAGEMAFAVLIKAFSFEKALMQEHFNENYMESGKFPKATFKGSIGNMAMIDLGKDGTYPAQVKGEMTIHGVTQPVETEGVFVVKDGKISASANFVVLTQDYNIDIPAVVRDNIAKEIVVDVTVDLEPLKTK
ncbi:YceI family protein [Neolewinella agarilytica]|uniref:Polyisoprenoid-binding protein YceI n=1 Tax=Neolewinella agarilytica TaxID=478744 RepID=A0A1H9H3W7_9BACT|nr:YceI family protein [Neolewinella agarilytica]SEQ57041.1 Polyisoprenoid-binding protein YceI [Neolewinella agarilytica]